MAAMYRTSTGAMTPSRARAGSGAALAGTPSGTAAGSYAGTPEEEPASSKNFRVVVRVRPPLPRELQGLQPFTNCVKTDGARSIIIGEHLDAPDMSASSGFQRHQFAFDHVYDQHASQRVVYDTTAKAVVQSSLEGYNATVFAYGQTGTGKTYTMEGFNSAEQRGIIPRAIEQIFDHITSTVSPRLRFLVRASYLQIYNEVISDLLKPERTNLAIREDKKRGVFVEGLSEWVVRSPEEIYGLMQRGGTQRATGSTRLNHMSSRSHAVFIIIVEQSETVYLDDAGNELSPEEWTAFVRARAAAAAAGELDGHVRQHFRVGKLNLVDLAGSERVRLTGATGQRLEESKKINQSLSALGNVISALTDPRGRSHIPYRDSKLTRILEDSLGGNCKTTMMAMISPALESFVESLSTLKFAHRAKSIKNEAHINEDVDNKSMLRKYERELKRLRAELQERSQSVVDHRKLLELDEQRRRAEQDKMAAIRALERRSQEFMHEKEEKRMLEDRISELESQMLQGGGGAVEDSPAFRTAIEEHQQRIRAEYEQRVAQLERERETMEEEKAQVDRYKQLLLKQRDIMILLTQRLNERDEQIVGLQDELDAYDRAQKELEERLDEKTAALIHLQRVAMEHNASSPVKSASIDEALGPWAKNGRAPPAPGASPGSHQPPHSALLITTRQYRPHEASEVRQSSPSTPARGAARGSDSAAVPTLLSAEEKISELKQLLHQAGQRSAELAGQLDEVHADKASLEFVLKNKLEQLVQSELNSRMPQLAGSGSEAAGAASTGSPRATSERQLAEMREQLAERETRIAELRVELEASQAAAAAATTASAGTAAAAAAPAPAALADLQRRLDAHTKERSAIESIMENKMKKLIDSIQVMADSSAPAPMAKEVRSLQRLVHACISAMHQSELRDSS